LRLTYLGTCGLLWLALGTPLAAQTKAPVVAAANQATDLNVNEWLMRTHEASRRRAYMGTFVVSAGGGMSSARIWHVCDGEQQMERIESLTGAPRSTFRLNDQVMTFLPENQVVVKEKRESLGLFPNLLHSSDSTIGRFYSLKEIRHERVAGFEADVLLLMPKDLLRFGYRAWTEQKSGLLLKLETLDTEGRVLEQAAFSELQLDAPVSMGNLKKLMNDTEGYRVEMPGMVKTSAVHEGWTVKTAVPGFKSMSCYKRKMAAGAESGSANTMQWIFSDGLASVSLFIEVFDARRHVQAGSAAMGATHTLTRRMGDWLLTVVGEVPPQTLAAFAQRLERIK
jgi:sigma-E factor negative regulatory protein RseB